MDTRTGEIVPTEEMRRRVEAVAKPARAAERRQYIKLTGEGARVLEMMSQAERIAFGVRRTNPKAAARMLSEFIDRKGLRPQAPATEASASPNTPQ